MNVLFSPILINKPIQYLGDTRWPGKVQTQSDQNKFINHQSTQKQVNLTWIHLEWTRLTWDAFRGYRKEKKLTRNYDLALPSQMSHQPEIKQQKQLLIHSQEDKHNWDIQVRCHLAEYYSGSVCTVSSGAYNVCLNHAWQTPESAKSRLNTLAQIQVYIRTPIGVHVVGTHAPLWMYMSPGEYFWGENDPQEKEVI